MRRSLHGLLVGVLTFWIPLDSAVAGWWLHHHPRHAMPVAWGPVLPCGGPPLEWGPGWSGAVVIDDRPLFAPAIAPAPVVFVIESAVIVEAAPAIQWGASPVVESVGDDCCTTSFAEPDDVVISEGVISSAAIIHDGASDCACDACSGEATVGDPIDVEGTTPYGALMGGATTTARPVDVPPPAIPGTETVPEPEAATPLEIPGAAATTTSADTAAPTLPTPEPSAASSSVLEPWEPKTVQRDSAADVEPAPDLDTRSEVPAATEDDDATAFETPAMEEGIDETIEEAPAAPVKPKRRNLFDEVPADEADAFEAPQGDDDSGLPVDAFEAPADQGFEAPADEPMDDAPMTEEPATTDDGFESPLEEAMDEAPADEQDTEEAPVEEPATEEAPAEADPFDSGILHTPGQPSRRWQDDTGRHSTTGRLVEVHADSVRILKATGRHTTVPMARLSAADREHVDGITLAAGRAADRAGDTAGL